MGEDPQNKTTRVLCLVYPISFMSRKHDVKEHIKGQKHINNAAKKNKIDSMRIFVLNQASVCFEII